MLGWNVSELAIASDGSHIPTRRLRPACGTSTRRTQAGCIATSTTTEFVTSFESCKGDSMSQIGTEVEGKVTTLLAAHPKTFVVISFIAGFVVHAVVSLFV